MKKREYILIYKTGTFKITCIGLARATLAASEAGYDPRDFLHLG